MLGARQAAVHCDRVVLQRDLLRLRLRPRHSLHLDFHLVHTAASLAAHAAAAALALGAAAALAAAEAAAGAAQSAAQLAPVAAASTMAGSR